MESFQDQDQSWGQLFLWGERHGGGSERARKIHDPAVLFELQSPSRSAKVRGRWRAKRVAKAGYEPIEETMRLSGQDGSDLGLRMND
jgi:hypothetical protein